jgi:hypothetical protein
MDCSNLIALQLGVHKLPTQNKFKTQSLVKTGQLSFSRENCCHPEMKPNFKLWQMDFVFLAYPFTEHVAL